MNFPHCHSKMTSGITRKMGLGYLQYRCSDCGSQFNERSGTPLNFIEYPTEVVMIAIDYYYPFKVSLDDLVELMMMHGCLFK